VVARFSPHRLYAFVRVGKLLLASLALTVAGLKFFPLLVLAALATSFAAWYRYMQILFTEYTLTEETLTVRKGIVARNFNNLELYRVKDYIVAQSVSERVFGLMTVKLITTDATHPELRLEGIALSDMAERIRDLVQRARLENRIFEIN